MTPMMLRLFTLVGIALAAASMQIKARAAGVETQAVAACAQAAGQPARPASCR